MALIMGIVVSFYLVNVRSGGMFLLLSAKLIREWAFRFPNRVLHPPQNGQDIQFAVSTTEFEGHTGVTVSPLRPCGEIELDNQKHSAISDNGRVIEIGTHVVVTGKRNGQLCVQVNNSDAG